MKSEYCSHCNIEHPPINGLLSNEIVRESHRVNYRNLHFEIWIIEHPNSHFWAWAIPTGTTEKLINEILYKLNYSIPSFNEGYYMAGYIYREECLKTKELALEDCKKELIEITNTILDSLLPSEEKKVNRLKEILKEIVGHICPKCKGALKRVYPNPEYWMCYHCIKGYNNEELKGEMKNDNL